MTGKIKLLIGIFIALLSASPSGAVISQSDAPSYTLMATGINYTAYFSPMNTNGFKFVVNDHSFIFLPRSISYTDEWGETTRHLGSAQDTPIQNTSDTIYFENAYGLGGQLRYLSNPLMIKEIYVLNELPTPSGNNDWMTLSSIAAFDNDLKLKYIDDSGVEQSWDGTKIKTNEIKFYDASDKFQFELPQPLAKDALDNTATGHYLIYEKDGIVYISARFSYAYLANMILPIYLDISLAEGEVAFGKSDYLIGETLDIWARGFTFSNERTLLYNPSNQVVKTFDWPSYADGWTSKYTYVSDASGWWRAELQTRSWLGGEWKGQDTAYAYVKTTATPTPTPSPTPTPTPTPTITVPPQPPSPIKGILYGYITSTSGESLSYVTIKVNTDETTSSGSDNQYVMYASAGWYYVTASLTGYISETKYAYIKDQSSGFTRLDFTIQPAVTPTPTATPDMTYRGSINMTKDEYYPGDTIEARAINLNTLPEYKIKWYENNVLINPIIQVSGVSDNTTSIQVPADKPIGTEYKVALTKKDDTVLSSDTARVVGRPSISMTQEEYHPGDTIVANAVNMNPSQGYLIKWYKDNNFIAEESASGASSKYTNKLVPGDNSAILSVYKVELTKSDGTFLSSDTAKIVVKPLKLKIGVILAKPSDKEPDPSHNKQYFENLLNRTRDYYIENSYGRIDINLSGSKIFDNNGNWYKLSKNNAYYGRDESYGIEKSNEFVNEAFTASNTNSGMYDIVAVVHPGDSEQISYPTNTDLMRTAPLGNAFVVSENELMGTWAHEAGHVVGYFEKNKDLTPERYVNGNLRSWDLMASGNYLTDDNGVSYPSHMSSWTKEYLGWLTYKVVYAKDTYWVPALEQMKYGDKVTVYDVPKQDGMEKYSYILEVRTEKEDYTVWDQYLYDPKKTRNDMLVIYQVNTTSIGSKSDVVNIYENNLSKDDMVILKPGDPYPDTLAEIKIDLSENIENTLNGYGGYAIIADNRISNQNGAAISTTGISQISTISSVKDPDLILPDYDLHAITMDGRHVGVNYTAGTYENHIEGATTSGDMLGGVEWIFVPENEDVRFTISNHDTGEFLKKYPWATNITDEMKYNLNIYHEDSMSSRYYSGVAEQQIVPGKERNYLFDIVQNPDGTYTVVLDNDPPVISNVNPANNSIAGREFNISATYEDGTGVDVNSIKLKVDGIDVTSKTTVTESSLLYIQKLDDGEHSFEITVADNMENTAIVNYSFTLDTKPPYVNIIYPADNSFVSQTAEIKGIANDLHLSAVSLEIDGAKVSDAEDFIWDTTTYADGMHNIRLGAADVVGNTNNTSVRVTVDNTPPEITITNISVLTNQTVVPIIKAVDARDTKPIISVSLDGAAYNGSPITTEGDHVLIVTASDDLGNIATQTLNFIIDKTKPSISISGVSDGSYYNIDVTPVITITDSNLDTQSITLNGAPFTSGTVISAEGSYTLVSSGTDKADNSDSNAVNFVIDKTKPSIDINGVTDGSYYNIDVTPVITITDANLDTQSITLNGAPFTSGTVVSTEGSYALIASGTDKAGNNDSKTLNFVIDKTKPDISISGVSDGSYYNLDVTPVITIMDANLDTQSITLNGAPFVSGTVVSTEGSYTLVASATDKAGNSDSKPVNFVIDKTKPSISISGVSNGSYYNLDVTPVITITDSNLDTQSITLNGAPFTSGTVISAEGSYTLVSSGTDKADNSDSNAVNFVIDKTKPSIDINGVTDGSYYNIDVTPVITITDSNLDAQSITLNGAPYTSGTVVSSEGSYTLVASATDKAGNSDSKTVNFVIDKTKPGIDISGVSDGSYYNIDVTPVITITDSNLDAQSITLNGAPYTSGTVISAEGSYTLVASATDKAGNSDSKPVNFVIDKTKPDISISGVSDGSYYNIDVTPVITITDSNLDVQSITLNGAPFVSGTVVSAEGSYALVASATDKAGNSDSKPVNFVIDKTPPSISITGAENDGFYNISKTISYVVTDNIDASPLISANYISGTVFNDETNYSVQISAKDHAGNIAIEILNFTIDKTPPSVNITSPNNDIYIGGIVKITGTATDLHIKMISLEIDNISTANTTDHLWDSTKITDGAHEIRLNAEDKAGNVASTLIKVRVDNTPPEIFNIIPQNNVVVDNSYSISADYDDAGSGMDINSFSLLIDDIDETKDASITNTSMQYKPSLQDGKHVLKLSVSDTVGNSRTVTTAFELDTTPPEVKINFPTNNSFVRQTITVSGIANDLHLDMISLEIDGIKVSSTSIYTWDTSLVNDGSHEIKLNAVDIVKNSASTSLNVIVDNTPPVIQLSPINGTEFYSDQNLTITYDVTDATSGVASSSVTLDGIAVTKGDIIDLRTLYIGSHIIQVNANDNAGNSAGLSTTFIVKPLQAIVDISPKTLNINSSGNWITGFIEVSGYSPEFIDISTVTLNDTIHAEVHPAGIGDHDENGAPVLMIKFNRSEVQRIVQTGDVVLFISGKVNGAAFTGDTLIRVIEGAGIGETNGNKGKEK